MIEKNSDKIKVREQDAEITIKDGEKEFRYARDEDGKLRIVSTKGLSKETPSVLNRLLNAEPKNCSKCLEGELSESITLLFFLNFLDEEDLLSCSLFSF